MREPPKIVSIASALAALAAPAAIPSIADAAETHMDQIPGELETGIQAETEAETRLPANTQLMSFTVHQAHDGTLFPQHGSHVSHASHASHASHISHISGLPVPGPPDPPNAPPSVPPPTATTSSTPTTTTSPAPAPTDYKYLACTRASNGYGVTAIANELEQVYGLSENNAASVAEQALVAVLTGGHYCDGYLR